jgi:predicted negative regulator of RcsB-dependent stress response
MAKLKVSRKDILKKPDEFITESTRAIIFAREHSSLFKAIGIAVIVLVLIYLGATTYMRQINKKGQEAFNAAYYSVSKKMGPGLDKETLTEAEDLFKKVTEDYGRSKAALLALPEMAYIKFMKQDYSAAVDLYRRFQDGISEDDPYQSLTNLALSVCFEENGEMDNAIKTLEQITSGQDDFFKEQAMLNLARIYGSADQEEKSQKILNDFVEKYPSSPFLALAKARLK